MSGLADKSMMGVINHFGKLLDESAPIPTPATIPTTVSRLTRGWAPCPLCKLSVDRCDCDPDEYAAAVYASMSNGGPQ